MSRDLPDLPDPQDVGDRPDLPDELAGVVDVAVLDVEFTGEVWSWRGPAPFYFITVPEEPSFALHALSSMVTYGWGMIPVTVRIGTTTWETALWPKDGRYVVPLKAVVRAAERLVEGDTVTVRLLVRE